MRDGGDGGDAVDCGNGRDDGYDNDGGIQHDTPPTSTDYSSGLFLRKNLEE